MGWGAVGRSATVESAFAVAVAIRVWARGSGEGAGGRRGRREEREGVVGGKEQRDGRGKTDASSHCQPILRTASQAPRHPSGQFAPIDAGVPPAVFQLRASPSPLLN